MMRFSTLIRHPADWMSAEKPEQSAVLTSRIRLARNLQDHPFPGWARRKERVAALEQLLPAVNDLSVMKGAFSTELSKLNPVQKQVLVERHLISREHAARGEGAAVVIERRQNFSIMINEEDHLRLQAIRPGLMLQEAYQALSELDSQLEATLPFAFDANYGYLTTCPSNLGTGLRASAMLHLPGLVLSDHIGATLKAVANLGLAVRGIYGEGTESLGNLFQISNQSTLGESEEAIIEKLQRVIREIATHEQNSREKLMEEEQGMLADKIGRAYGTLAHAYLIDSKEALNHISLVRLGGNLGFFPTKILNLCDVMMMDIQQAHLQMHVGTKLAPSDRDYLRAEIIRTRLETIDISIKFSPTEESNHRLPQGDHTENL